MPSRILSNHRSILFNYLLLPLQQIHFWHSSNDPTVEIPLALPFSSKKKRKTTRSVLYILTSPLNANFQSQTISNFLLKSIRKPINCFLEVKKAGEGGKTTSNHPKPSQTELRSTGSTCTSSINKYRERGHRSVNPNIRGSRRSTAGNRWWRSRDGRGRGRERLAMSRVTHRHVRVEKLANWLSGNNR